MTPFQIDILLHYVAHTDDHPVVIKNPPIWPETRKFFLDNGLLALEPEGRLHRNYQLGEAGRVYMQHLLDIPLPIQKWVMP